MPRRGHPARHFQPATLVARLMALSLAPFIQRLRIHESCVAPLRLLAEKGHIVYVMRARSLLDFVLLQTATRRAGLPLPHFVNALSTLYWMPLRTFLRRLFRRARDDRWRQDLDKEVNWLVAAAHSAPASLLFLRQHPPLWGRDPLPDRPYIPALADLQRHGGRPVYLVPTLLLWEKAPRRAERSLMDILFGPIDMPGRIRKLWLFMRHSHNAFFRMGDAIDLRAEAPKLAADDEVTLNKKMRRVLLHYLAREERVIQGPPLPNRDRILRQIVEDHKMRQFIEEEARQENRSPAAVEKDTRKCLDEIAANYDIRIIQVIERLLRVIWSRIYEGMEIDEEGIEMARQLSKEASIVYVPCHKSHLDYLILPYISYNRDIQTPYIAAGINLSFWPVGPIIRRAGAYFIRRSFKGNRIYANAFERYVVYLLKNGFPQLFYIEGTRSRTGKLMPPKYGMLGMMLRAYLSGEVRKMVFIPCSVGYERTVEGASYTKEMTGGEKQAESVGGLLKATSILNERYGKVYVRFGQPIDPEELLPDLMAAVREEGDTEGKRTQEALTRMGGAILDGINTATVIHPSALTAMVLLAHPKRGIAHSKLVGRATALLDFLLFNEAPLAAAFVDVPAALEGAVGMFQRNRMIERIEFEGESIYSIVERQRIVLDIAKNNAIHIFAPISLASSAILAALVREKHFDQVTMSVRVKEAAAEYAFIRRLLGDEFRFPGAEAGDEAALLDTLRYFLDRGLLEHDEKEGLLRITARQDFFGRTSMKTLLLYSLLTYSYLESYYLLLDSLGAMESRTMDARAFVHFAFTRGSKIFAVGNIIKREAILKVPLENAYRHFKSDGMISEEEPEVKKRGKAKGGVLTLSPEQNVRRLQIMSQLRGFFEYHKQRFLGI